MVTPAGGYSTTRSSNMLEQIQTFLALYFVSLFSFNAYAAAEQSPYNVRNRGRSSGQRTWGSSGVGSSARSWFEGFGGGSVGGRGGSSAADASRRRRGGFGTVDDIRGPECRSCQ